MKIATVIGARPQFIKASAISREIRRVNKLGGTQIQEVIIHTGQHFDKNMSNVFFTELDIPKPDYNLEISSLLHGAMTGRMLESVEKILQEEKPDVVLVYGDTNSTLAGALAASKMHIPVAHVEAGLRSFNMRMPEEINRILTDHISNYLFCPTQAAVKHLKDEGIIEGVHQVGDVMYDVTLHFREKAKKQISLGSFGLEENNYVLCTVHRAENTDDVERLLSIFEALVDISEDMDVVVPAHPRTSQLLKKLDINKYLSSLTIIEPLSYLEMLRLEMSAKVILTDSGGVQKEAFFNQTPCITLRDETEWVETVNSGWNQLVGADKESILIAYGSIVVPVASMTTSYGKGIAAKAVLQAVSKQKY